MGTFYVKATLASKASVEALVDTGATHSKMPIDVLRSLKIRPSFSVKVQLGDGRIVSRKVGYVTMRLDGRSAPVPVMFGKSGETPLIGATTLEILGLAVDPVKMKLTESPILEI
jgi:predicted aspartyl protease